jgi:GNAT superfamily N-acetyltransferase
MQTPGDPEVCWCQVFRVRREDWDARPVEQNRADLEALVRGPHPPGLLAYVDDEPAGWCSIAPLAELTRVRTSSFFTDARDADEDLTGRWALTCFMVREEARGQGLLPLLLSTAVDHARVEGATSIEAYPLDPGRAEEVGPDELFAGTVRHFEAAGFTAVAELGPARTLMVLDL